MRPPTTASPASEHPELGSDASLEEEPAPTWEPALEPETTSNSEVAPTEPLEPTTIDRSDSNPASLPALEAQSAQATTANEIREAPRTGDGTVRRKAAEEPQDGRNASSARGGTETGRKRQSWFPGLRTQTGLTGTADWLGSNHPTVARSRLWLALGVIVAVAGVLAVSIPVLSRFASSPGTTDADSSLEDTPWRSPSPAATEEPTTSPEWTTQELTVQATASPRGERTGLMCVTGDRLDITATGEAWLDQSEAYPIGPDGLPEGLPDEALPEIQASNNVSEWAQQLMRIGTANTGALYALIDDPNTGTASTSTRIGSEGSLTCQSDGELLLGLDDGYPWDNRGEFDVMVIRIPA